MADVDSLADLWLRVLLPYAIVLAAATAATVLVGWLVPVAGLVLGVTLVLVAFLVPLAAGAVGRDAERRVAPARGALAAAATDLLAERLSCWRTARAWCSSRSLTASTRP